MLSADLQPPPSADDLSIRTLVHRTLAEQGHPRIVDNARWRLYDHARGTLQGAVEQPPEQRLPVAVQALYVERDSVEDLLADTAPHAHPPWPTTEALWGLVQAQAGSLRAVPRWTAVIERREPDDQALHETLRASLPAARRDDWPLSDYFSGRDAGDGVGLWCKSSQREHIAYMEPDDDIHYTLVGLGCIEAHGLDFDWQDIGRYWLRHLPIFSICTAEAQAIEKKLVAEATGLAEKATAMKALDGVGREHEEFRLRLDKEREVELAQIAVRQHIAQAQAEVMAQAMAQAKINIVGGDGEFFDRFVKAVSLGQSADAFVDGSTSVQTLMKDYLSGDKSLVADVKDVLSAPRVDTDDLKNLGVTALLARLAKDRGGEQADKLQRLVSEARKLGLD